MQQNAAECRACNLLLNSLQHPWHTCPLLSKMYKEMALDECSRSETPYLVHEQHHPARPILSLEAVYYSFEQLEQAVGTASLRWQRGNTSSCHSCATTSGK